MTMKIQVVVFRVVTFSDVKGCYFGGPYCLHLHSKDGDSTVLWNLGM